METQSAGEQQAVMDIDIDRFLFPLERAIRKQRLLFLAVYGLQGFKLMEDEALGLTGCIAETIGLIHNVIDQARSNPPWELDEDQLVTPEDMRWQIEQETFFAIHKDYTEPPLFDALNAEVLRLANLPESAGKKGIQILLDAKANIDKQGSVEG